MAIQIIPKKREGSSIFMDILLYLSVFLFLAALVGYFIINSALKKTEGSIMEVDAKLAEASNSPEAALVDDVLFYQKKIESFSYILSSHVYVSQVFPFIEKLTHPKVFFTSFEEDSQENKIVLSGITEDFQTLGQQLEIFKTAENIEEVELSEISFDEDGKVSFGFNLVFNPIIFTR
jgi:hypothetical protein